MTALTFIIMGKSRSPTETKVATFIKILSLTFSTLDIIKCLVEGIECQNNFNMLLTTHTDTC